MHQQSPNVNSATVWMAMHPGIASDASQLLHIIESVFGILRPYGCRSVWTSEPRTYAMGETGRRGLADGLQAARIRQAVLSTPERGISGMLDLTPKLVPRAGLTVRATDGEDGRLATALLGEIALIEEWFPRTDAAMAFISLDDQDWYLQTAHEAELGQGALVTWQGVRHFLRGVFWGLALGPDLCEQLGGKESVLNEAPVPVARRLGNGVWLQASKKPDPDSRLLSSLRNYLAPLLSWTRADTGALPTPPVATEPARSPAIHRRSRPRTVRRIHIEFMKNAGIDTGLMVYFAAPPPATQVTAIERLVGEWYGDGLMGAFGGSGFHELTGPTVHGTVMRWRVDFGSSNPRVAVRWLAEELASFSEPSSIERIVVGTKVVDDRP
jgi:hypothetical protein